MHGAARVMDVIGLVRALFCLGTIGAWTAAGQDTARASTAEASRRLLPLPLPLSLSLCADAFLRACLLLKRHGTQFPASRGEAHGWPRRQGSLFLALAGDPCLGARARSSCDERTGSHGRCLRAP